MDRNENGQFAQGNPGNKNAPGRPKRAKEEKYLKALLRTVSPKDWILIVEKAVQQAQRGDYQARKWLADYIIGSPVQRAELTGLDGHEVIIRVIYDK